MTANQHDEIAASVAAFGALGPGYDQAVAEGLVERIGAEIDRRVAAATPPDASAEAPLDCRHCQRHARRHAPGRIGPGAVLLAIGSMGVALAVTAIVLVNGVSNVAADGAVTRHGPGGGPLLLTALIWLVIGAINITYARRQR